VLAPKAGTHGPLDPGRIERTKTCSHPRPARTVRSIRVGSSGRRRARTCGRRDLRPIRSIPRWSEAFRFRRPGSPPPLRRAVAAPFRHHRGASAAPVLLM